MSMGLNRIVKIIFKIEINCFTTLFLLSDTFIGENKVQWPYIIIGITHSMNNDLSYDVFFLL